MSLDFAILDSNGAPKNQVSIGLNAHYMLMHLADQTKGRLLKRLNDYYADAEFDISELETLLRELIYVRAKCPPEEPLFSVLKDVMDLAEAARLEQKPLVVISD